MSIFSKPVAPVTIPAKQIKPIYYNGLSGRIVHIAARGRQKKPIVLIAGMHSAHERMYSFGSFFSRYGEVYMIDMPGFGGMDSFKKIGMPITYESYAEYLYAVLKTQKLTKNVTIFAISIGSLNVTKMLQMFPDSQAWFERYIAFVGFTKWADFKVSWIQKVLFAPFGLMAFFSPLLRAFEILFLNRILLKPAMWVFSHTKAKMQTEDPNLMKQNIQMESFLWHVNDLRTYGRTILNLRSLDIRRGAQGLITVPFYNVTTPNDQYFDEKEVQKGFRDLFSDIHLYKAAMNVHMPSVLDGEEAIQRIFDPDIIDVIMKRDERSRASKAGSKKGPKE